MTGAALSTRLPDLPFGVFASTRLTSGFPEVPRRRKAIEIDPLLTEAYEALAMADARDAHWRAAEQEFRHAIETDPDDSRTRAEFAMWFLAVLGRSGEAIEQARRAEIDDPLASDVQIASALSLMEAGRYEEAESHCAKLPSDVSLRAQCLGRARLGQGRIADGIATLRAATEEHFNPQTLGFLGYALARAGLREEAQRVVADSKGPNEEALIYAGLGDRDRTIDALERMAARGAQRAASTCIRRNCRRCSPVIRVCLLCERRSACRNSVQISADCDPGEIAL